jgi:prolyl-tRNA editing enzyme YbaK/EbsC (Cys-tRNA(Pro) deacylase)
VAGESVTRPDVEHPSFDGREPATPGHPPERLAAYLRAHGVDAEFVAPGVPMPTVPLAAAAIGVDQDRILKSLLFRDRTGKLALAIACGTGRVDRDRLAAVAGLDRPRMADAATVLAATGYPAGGVPPVGHAAPLAVVVDRRVAALEVAYGGGGAEEVLLRIRPTDILRLTGATVADIADGNTS